MEINYFNNILNIRDKHNNTVIPKEKCSIQKISSMYSNTKQPIFKLVIDDKPISRNNTYVVTYKCQTCKLNKAITLNLYMRKVNKEKVHCDTCKNSNDDKCKAQSEFMKQHVHTILAGEYIKPTNVKSHVVDERMELSIQDWEKEEDDFKENYYLHHLTVDDFQRIRNKIISINQKKYTNIDEWDYFPIYRIYNQTRYTPMLIHKTEKCVEKPLYIEFICENCDSSFIHRDIEVVKNRYKMLCQTCSLTNKTFCIRHKILKNGTTIMWQSIPERRFIEWCEEHEIDIKNGPKIAYHFKEKEHIYRVDFELPQQRLLIEIKDNHCWHAQQVASGKFAAKENAAKEWSDSHHYTYHVIFPKTLQKCKDSILTSL
jgi:hypothetical protein